MVVETASRRLLAKQKIQTQPADFDDVAIIEARRPLNRSGVHGGRSVSRPDVVAVVALINLRDDGYYIGAGDRTPTVNARPIQGPTRLNNGDVIEICGLRLNFLFRE